MKPLRLWLIPALIMSAFPFGGISPQAGAVELGCMAEIQTQIDSTHFERAIELLPGCLDALEQRKSGEQAAPLIELVNLASGIPLHADVAPFWERAIIMMEKLPGNRGHLIGRALMRLSTIAREGGDLELAAEKIDRAYSILSVAAPGELDFALALQGRGELALTAGDFASARSDLEHSLEIKEKSGIATTQDIASSAMALGHILFDLGDLEAAIGRYQEALDRFDDAYGPESAPGGTALYCLAQCYRRSGDPERSKEAYEKTFEIYEKRLDPNHPNVLKAINGYAILLATTGDLASARKAFEKALVIKQRTMGAEHPSVAIALNNLARIHYDLEEYEQSRARYEQCLSIREKIMGAHHPHLVETRINLALVLHEMGEFDRAFDLSLDAERSGREHFLLTARGLSEREALDYSAVRASGLNLALSISAGTLSPERRINLWNAVVRSRALVLDEMAQRHRFEAATADPLLAELADSLSLARAALAQLHVRGPRRDDDNPYEEQLLSARKVMESLERRLGLASSYFQAVAPGQPVSPVLITEALPHGSTMVSYLRYLKKSGRGAFAIPSYMALVVQRGDSVPRMIPLGDVKEIDNLVYHWKEEASRGALTPGRSVEQSLIDYRVAAEALGARIWEPLVAELEGAERVFLVPDGSIGLVNFAALLDRDGRFLAEGGPLLHYISAEKDLLSPSWQKGENSGLLALGAPDFDSPGVDAGGYSLKSESHRKRGQAGSLFQGLRSNCGEMGGLHFKPLPGSASEIEEISSLWERFEKRGGGTIALLTGKMATESELRQQAVGKEVLHISTHGFFLDGSCPSLIAGARGIGLLVEDEPEGDSIEKGGAFDISGLALAGANRREEAGPDEDDGILTAEEIVTFELTGVRWAILSACETGVGTIRAGEGILGLRRAFRIAGARTLVMSLWAVDDQATREWMKTLYESLFLSGLNTMESMRAANLSVLGRLQRQGKSVHPFYWAGFIAAGDWR